MPQDAAPRTNHDQNFKNLILDYPLQALAFFAGDEAPVANEPVRITPIRQEQLQGRLGDRFRELDVPLLVEWADGRREALLFALEEETDSRRFSVHRLAHYCLDLAELFNTQRVVPVVIFLNPADGVPQSLTLGSDRHRYLLFDYLSCELPALPFEHWQHSDNLVARLNLLNMRWPTERKIEVYNQALRGLLSLEPDLNKQAKYIDFIDIYAQLTDNERQRYEQEYPEESAMVVGRMQQAREAGIQEGMQQGERDLLERLLQRRFGTLTPSVLQKLQRASTTELETWADRVLDAGSLEDVFKA